MQTIEIKICTQQAIQSVTDGSGCNANRDVILLVGLLLGIQVEATTKRRSMMEEEGSYICSACGEEIVIPLDVSAGQEQEYVEDCPVCCRPHLLQITWCQDTAEITARPE